MTTESYMNEEETEALLETLFADILAARGDLKAEAQGLPYLF